MRGTHAYLIFGAYHAEALNATDFGFLDLEFFAFRTVEGCADSGYDDALAGGYIRRATHYLGGLAVAEVDGGDVEMVAVGVVDAGEYVRAFFFYLYRTVAFRFELHREKAE